VALYDPRSRGAEAYAALAEEFLRRDDPIRTPEPLPQADGDTGYTEPVEADGDVVSNDKPEDDVTS